MLKPFNLDKIDLKQVAVLLQGTPNSGKTHLACDMLLHERQFGKVAYLDITGERGATTAANMGLGDVGVTAETPADVREFAAKCIKEQVHAVAIDGIRRLGNLLLIEQVQSKEKYSQDVRLPDSRLDGDSSKTYWSQARFQLDQIVTLLKVSVNILIGTSTVQVDVHEVTGVKQIAPDLYGKMGTDLVGLFDFAGYLELPAVLGPGRTRHAISFQARSDVRTRQRLPRPITESIVLPTGLGGWATIKAAFEAGLGKEKK